MQITCLGATRCVTGSSFLLEDGAKLLIDCGLFQGGTQIESLNRAPWKFDPRDVEAILLTHAHIDHSGRIPKLVKDGFRGPIYATLPTVELCKILLLDSAHIQEMEAEWQTKRSRRQGGRDVSPLYTVEDARACLPLFQVVPADKILPLGRHLKVRFRNAGHILGSSILEIWGGPTAQPHKVVFSGDLGHKNQLIVEDPHSIYSADTLFIESTYGNRNHKSLEESRRELLEAIHTSYNYGEKVLIPAFAIARTQEILYILGEFFRKKLIPSLPVYLDSPLAIAATDIFRKMRSFYDKEAMEIVENGEDPFSFPQLILSRTAQESMAINQTPGPAIIIAGNGMCTAGRIKHHLKHNLWRRGASLVIVGFQAAGTLGRKIVEGNETVKIFGEKIVVRARVFTIGGLSAHGGQTDLLEWLGHFENPKMRVYAVHGEPTACEEFARLVHKRLGFLTSVPTLGEVVQLTPPEPGAAVEPEALWQNALDRLLQRTEHIRQLLGSTPQPLPGDVLQQLERDMEIAERRLQTALQGATPTSPTKSEEREG